MLLQIGDFQFTIATVVYQELQRTTAARWATLDVVGSDQRLQAVGRENERIRFSGVFYPIVAAQVEGAVGTVTMDTLRDMVTSMKPQLLTAENGESFGYWIAESLETGDSRFLRGIPQRQEFTLSIRWYGATV